MSKANTPPAVNDSVQQEIQIMFDRFIVEPISNHTSEKAVELQNRHSLDKSEVIDCVERKSRQLLGKASEIDDRLTEHLSANQEKTDEHFNALPTLLLKYTQPIYNETKTTHEAIVNLSAQLSDDEKKLQDEIIKHFTVLSDLLREHSALIHDDGTATHLAVKNLFSQLAETTVPIKQGVIDNTRLLVSLKECIETVQADVLKEVLNSSEKNALLCGDIKQTITDCSERLGKDVVEHTSKQITSALQSQNSHVVEDNDRVISALTEKISSVDSKLDSTLIELAHSRSILTKLLIASGVLNIAGIISVIIILLT